MLPQPLPGDLEIEEGPDLDELRLQLDSAGAMAFLIADKIVQAVAAGDRSPQVSAWVAEYQQHRVDAQRIRRLIQAQVAG